ncbi:MAG TPA: nuclear transport factor 2 family protein [Gemmatimonadaceae bacterium]|nr:nuclear transport factor 2 family protein [Gemmatimonadaceae bacterium]
MTPRIVLSLIGLAFILAILKTFGTKAGAAAPLEREREAIEREIETQFRETYDLSQPDVVDRLLSLYPDSGRVVSASAGQLVTSRDSLAEGIRYFWNNVGRNMREPRWIWDEMLVDVLAQDAAVLTARYHVPHLTPDGRTHVIGGAWTAALVRRGGRWVIVQEHLTDAPLPDSLGEATEEPAPSPVDTSLLRGP